MSDSAAHVIKRINDIADSYSRDAVTFHTMGDTDNAAMYRAIATELRKATEEATESDTHEDHAASSSSSSSWKW